MTHYMYIYIYKQAVAAKFGILSSSTISRFAASFTRFTGTKVQLLT